MATATAVQLDATTLHLFPSASDSIYEPAPLEDPVLFWASILRQGLGRLYRGQHVDKRCYDAPRRKSHTDGEAEMAAKIAGLIYPTTSDSTLPAVIKYEKDIAFLRRAVVAREKMINSPSPQEKTRRSKVDKVVSQGPWIESEGPPSLTGVSAKPMPVEVSKAWQLAPFFRHLSNDGGVEVDGDGRETEEPYYGVRMGEWNKGMLYQDGRMDLCKMVVGPQHIGSLMDSLEKNTFVRHFLLGNNIIGSTGAEKIVSYLSRHPNQIETWYLAGNCIDSDSLKLLVDGWTASSSITNIWLKRNPLGPSSVPALLRLITGSLHLRTLDLDQTELGDAGVADMFDSLADSNNPNLPIRHLYLNANGINVAACRSIATYLATAHCSLQSLYISNNPIGDQGGAALAEGLRSNTSLLRLSLRSCGLKNAGAMAIMDALTCHPAIMTLQVGYNYATEDLGARHNFFDDSVKEMVSKLINKTKTLQLLDLGVTGMTLPVIVEIADAVCDSTSLLTFKVESISDKIPRPLKRQIRARLAENVKAVYGDGMTYERFEAEEHRWLISPKDVRLIDSGYRNRDANLARRGAKVVDKLWKDEDELARVMKEQAI